MLCRFHITHIYRILQYHFFVYLFVYLHTCHRHPSRTYLPLYQIYPHIWLIYLRVCSSIRFVYLSRCICWHLWAATTTLCHLYLVQLNRPSFHEINHRIDLVGSGWICWLHHPISYKWLLQVFVLEIHHQFSASRRGDRQAENKAFKCSSAWMPLI